MIKDAAGAVVGYALDTLHVAAIHVDRDGYVWTLSMESAAPIASKHDAPTGRIYWTGLNCTGTPLLNISTPRVMPRVPVRAPNGSQWHARPDTAVEQAWPTASRTLSDGSCEDWSSSGTYIELDGPIATAPPSFVAPLHVEMR